MANVMANHRSSVITVRVKIDNSEANTVRNPAILQPNPTPTAKHRITLIRNRLILINENNVSLSKHIIYNQNLLQLCGAEEELLSVNLWFDPN